MITGHTKIIAHLGVPTNLFRAPMLYNPWFEAREIDAVVIPMGCEAEHFAEFFRLVFKLTNIVGALVTMPHKVSVVDLLDEVSDNVALSGACNVVKRGPEGQLTGEMFDGKGFVSGARDKGCDIDGSSALVIGNGGVGSAIAASLANEGLARIGLCDQFEASSRRLATRLGSRYPKLRIETGARDTDGWNIIVNATPLGMTADDPLPVEMNTVSPSTFVGDVVMSDGETPFITAAKNRGCSTQIGVDMLFEQIPACLNFLGYPKTTAEELRAISTVCGDP